jgi:hypothetical protein
MQLKNIKTIIEFLPVPMFMLLAGAAESADYTGSVRAGLSVSDNIRRTADMKIDETTAIAGFDFGAITQSRTINLNLNASFDYLDYLDDSYDAEWVGGLSGSAIFSLVEERLRWVVQENFGQQLRNPFQPARPDNREDINHFSTGPTINFLTGGRNSLVLDARYSLVSYEERPADNDRLSGTLSFGRELSRDSSVSFNVSGTRVEYDESLLFAPYEGHSAYLKYETTGSQNALGVNLGYNEIERQGNEGDGILARLSWTRTISANSKLSLTGGSRYSDQGDIFRLLQENSTRLGDTFDAADSTAPFRNNYLALRYSLNRERYSIATALTFDQEDYEGGLGRDRDQFGGMLNLRREVSRTVYAGARVQFKRRDYKYEGRSDDDLTLAINAGYRFSEGFDVSLSYQHFRRNSDVANADFTENRAYLRASYTPKWAR